MSEGADPQKTLRDYFERNGGIKHVLIANIYNESIEFYVRPENTTEEEGMHFILQGDGRIIEVGIWK